MLNDEPLDYEALVDQYNENLFLVLRGHRSAEYLDTWVPDEDPLKGILNMIEAAELAGQDEIAIFLRHSTLRLLDVPAVQAAASRIGDVKIEPREDGVVVHVFGIARSSPRAAPSRQISAPYQAAIAAAGATLRHTGPLSAGEPEPLYAATIDGSRLSARINGAGKILAAAHDGAQTLAAAAVLDVFCDELVGMTVQEAAEHGAIRLEFRLRAGATQRSVAGIVLPRNADQVFELPARLIRALAAAYREQTGAAFGPNGFTRPIGAAWLRLSDDEKLAKVNGLLAERIVSLGLGPQDASAIAVEQHYRVTIAFGEGVPIDEKPRFLRRLERVLHQSLEPSIQVFMSEVKDANKMRRL